MNFELVKILKDGETYVSGYEMLKRAKELGITSSKKEADYFLEHQKEIPEEWRDYYLIFPEYLLDDDDRDRQVAYFGWYGWHWVLNFGWLGSYFSDYDRFVRPRESLETKALDTSVLERLDALEEFKKKIKKMLIIK